MKAVTTMRPSRRAVGLALGLCAVAACGDAGVGIETLSEIERNRARWERLGIDSYAYAVERRCFCLPEALGPVRVTVSDGVVTLRSYVDSGEAVSESRAELFPSVDGIFLTLLDAVERDAFRIDVTFDPASGVPLDVWIDYERDVADEELGFRVTEMPRAS